MNEEQEREKFEAWIMEFNFWSHKPRRFNHRAYKSIIGQYVGEGVELAWEAWKAAVGLDS